ncbi:hypothetical protein ACFVTC_33920 [Streptomyces sp. NPDC057950]
MEVVLGALQQWGDRHLPRPEGPSIAGPVRRRVSSPDSSDASSFG